MKGCDHDVDNTPSFYDRNNPDMLSRRKKMVNRREILQQIVGGTGIGAGVLGVAAVAASVGGSFVVLKVDEAFAADNAPTDFTVIQETKLPFSQYYVENAQRLMTNLQWAVTSNSANVDFDQNIKTQINEFNALYRRDNYTLYGPLPGMQSLLTAYSSAADHYARYTRNGNTKEMPESLIKTIERNLTNAQKQIEKSDLSMSKMMEVRGI